MSLEPPLKPFAPQSSGASGAFVFFSYAHRDKLLRDRLDNHLSNLKYRGLITSWYDREIEAGEEWTQQIDIRLNKAHIILLLISADFMASQYCYSIEMKQALERHERREADVIPILLRKVLITDAPFAKLYMLPTDGKPVTKWRDRDSAFFDIACGIEKVAKKYLAQSLEGASAGDVYASQVTLGNNSSSPLEIIPPFPIVAGAASAIAIIVGGILTLIQHPTHVPFEIYLIICILAFLLLIAGVAVIRKEIKSIRERGEQRRAQEASEAARKRSYYGEAIEAYQHALSHNPSDGDAFLGMGYALYALEHYSEALSNFQKAIHCKPTSTAWSGLGDVFEKRKRYSEAVAAYQKAIELDPTVTLYYEDFIRSVRVLGRKEEAKQVHVKVKQRGYEMVS